MLSGLRIKVINFTIIVIEKLVFERQLRKYYKKIFGNNINLVIDVGSNKGQTIDFFLRINPDCNIYGFEPNPDLYNYLVNKYRGKQNVHLLNMGVSSETGELLFHENVLDLTSSFESLNKDSSYLKTKARLLGVSVDNITKKSYPVKTIALSEFIESNIHTDIDIVKLDTEGHEYACLLGLFKKNLPVKIRYMQLESHNDNMYDSTITDEDISGILKKNNFEPAHKIDHRIGDFDEIIYRNTKI